ncbi:DGQHR domain-containing protein [Rhizobium laguerreae]|uniref:DGQHR domain-containing protein n=1 Tax=Rhizobium laguerreae TaxID=1076926 RepID=UPI001442806C|nr:DGQHR domain-containing protein [Rhizobium laguerreae]NKM42081.1 DGQHR domain-containing protein [Rhizobium laguerreae]
MSKLVIRCLKGQSADRPVLIGFAPADVLLRHSFADVFFEDSGSGYQRPFSTAHSQDFRRYISQPGATTIPLTLNLRPQPEEVWWVSETDGACELSIASNAGKIMAQVDCQHRLGHLANTSVTLPFMCFLGLSVREEMEIFNVINSKAKGLSRSLLDYHDAQFANDLATDRPELFIALFLNAEEASPWFKRMNLGGTTTTGLKRIASLRLMQQSILDFMKFSGIKTMHSTQDIARIVLDFWIAVKETLPAEWADPRRHLLTKGVGVYALMRIAADLVNEARDGGFSCDKRYFAAALCDFVDDIDWTTTGALQGFGGHAGVKAACEHIRDVRRRARFKVINGQ